VDILVSYAGIQIVKPIDEFFRSPNGKRCPQFTSTARS
jgi:hypothetical protein